MHHWSDWAGLATGILVMLAIAWLAIAAALNSGDRNA